MLRPSHGHLSTFPEPRISLERQLQCSTAVTERSPTNQLVCRSSCVQSVLERSWPPHLRYWRFPVRVDWKHAFGAFLAAVPLLIVSRNRESDSGWALWVRFGRPWHRVQRFAASRRSNQNVRVPRLARRCMLGTKGTAGKSPRGSRCLTGTGLTRGFMGRHASIRPLYCILSSASLAAGALDSDLSRVSNDSVGSGGYASRSCEEPVDGNSRRSAAAVLRGVLVDHVQLGSGLQDESET